MKKRMCILLMAGVLAMGPSGVVLAGDMESGSDMEISMWQAEQRADVRVQTILLETEKVSALGGEVQVTVTGTGLTGENWGIEAKAYIAGTDFEMSEYKVHVKDVTCPCDSEQYNEKRYRIQDHSRCTEQWQSRGPGRGIPFAGGKGRQR